LQIAKGNYLFTLSAVCKLYAHYDYLGRTRGTACNANMQNFKHSTKKALLEGSLLHDSLSKAGLLHSTATPLPSWLLLNTHHHNTSVHTLFNMQTKNSIECPAI